jgi:putative membrane protein
MKAMPTDDSPHPGGVGADGDPKTLLAFARTGLAADRTLMAWIRTAFSMISFGFTIGKFFEYLNEQSHRTAREGNGHVLAVLLITLGIASLVAGVWEYRHAVNRLEEAAGLGHRTRSILVVAILVALLGVVALAGLFVRLDRI